MTHQNEDIVAREISKNDKDDDNSETFIEKKLIGLCLRLLKDIKAKSLNNDSFVTVENSQRNLLYFKNLSFSKETGIFTLSDLKLNRNLKLSDLLHSESLSEWNSHVESVNVSIVSSPIFKKCTNHLRLHSSLNSCWNVTTYSIFSDYISSMNNIKHFCSLHYVNQKIENCPIEIGPELFDFKITESIYPPQSKQGSNKKCNSHQNISNNRNKESNSASEKLEYHGLLEKLLSSHEAVTILNQVKEGEEKIKELDFNHQNSPNNKEKNKRGILERLLSPANDDLSQKELSKLKTTSWLLSNQSSVIASDRLKKIRKLSSYEKPNYDTLVSLKRSRHATTPGAIYQSQSLPGKAPSCKGSFSENDGKSSLAELLSDESNMNESANSNDSNQRIYKSTLLYGNQNCVSKQCTSQRHKSAILAANTVMKIASELSKKQEHSQDLINVRERLLSKQAVIPLSNQSTGLDDGESKLSDDGSTSGENMAAYDHENHVPGNIHHYKKNYGGKDELNDDESLISANNIKSVLKEIAPNRVLTKSDASNRTHLTLIMPKKENSAKSRIDTSKPIKEKSRLPPITKSSPYQILLPNTQTVYQIVKPISQSYNQSTTYSFPRIISLPISNTSMAETNLTPSTSTEMPIIIYEPVINTTHKNTIKRNQPLSNQENSSILSNNSRVVQTTMSSNEIYNTPMDTSLVSSPPIDMIVNTVLDLEQEIYSDPKETDINIEKAATQFFKLPSLSAICKLPT